MLNKLVADRQAMDKLEARRDKQIAQARVEGATWRAIAAACGMTELATRTAATRGNGGVLPQPGERFDSGM